MANREPKDATILAARIAKAFPSLSAYAAARLAHDLDRIGIAFHRHEERRCNGPRDVRERPQPGELFGYMRLVPKKPQYSQDPRAPAGKGWEHDEVAEQAAAQRIANGIARWRERLATWARIPTSQTPLPTRSDAGGLYLEMMLPGEKEPASV